MASQWIIKGGTCLLSDPKDPMKLSSQNVDIHIENGKIVEIGENLEASGAEVFSAQGLHILPGIIDSQVHFRDPGAPHKEDFESGTKGAIQGGVTAVFDMPNTKPNTSTRERFLEKIEITSRKAYCDFGLFAGATNDNYELLPELEKLEGCCGIKIFMGSSTGDLLVSEDVHLEKVLSSGKRMVAVHCEDEARLIERKPIAEEKAHPSAHPEWRDELSAFQATERIVNLAKKTGRKIHVLHITTEEELDFLAKNKDYLTVEILPQHLYFHAPDCYEKYGSRVQMNPPIRAKRHQEALWRALNSGVVDVIGSDHAPHTLEEKAKPYPQSPSGIPGVQTIFPLLLHFVSQGKLTLEKVIQLMSIKPAQIYKAQGKGGIYVGQDADFTVVDMNLEKTIESDWIESRCGYTPYEGLSVKGWPVATIIRGHMVMKDGKILEKVGKPISFATP